jgi:hypothetical protein
MKKIALVFAAAIATLAALSAFCGVSLGTTARNKTVLLDFYKEETQRQIAAGEQLTVLEFSEGYVRVQTQDSKVGYLKLQDVNSSFVIETFDSSVSGKVNAKDVNLREQANIDAVIVLQLKKGDQVAVLGRQDCWYKVSCDKSVGYVHMDYIDIAGGDAQKIYPTLKMGVQSKEVQNLQEALAALGYFCAPADGSYGANTRRAVREIEKDNNLIADGIADHMTQALIYEQLRRTK